MRRILLWAAALGVLAWSCSSVPLIREGLSSAELVQHGQEASSKGRYRAALVWYQAVLERFPLDMDVVCAAEYEIAFLHFKQGGSETARGEFRALLARYDSPDAELLPPQYKILANKMLERLAGKGSGGKGGKD